MAFARRRRAFEATAATVPSEQENADFTVDAGAGVYAPGPYTRRYLSLPFRAKA